MEEVRSSATKASKVVKLVQSGKISLDALVGPNGALSPSRSAAKRRVGRPKAGLGLVALSRSSQSAGAELTMSDGGAIFFSEGAKRDAEEAPKPYVSPYVETASSSA